MRNYDRGVFAISFLLIVIMGSMFTSCEGADAASRIKTYYTNRDMYGVNNGIVCTRCIVKSYYMGSTVKFGKKKEVGVVRNTGKKPLTRGLSLTRSTKRSFSLSLSAAIPKEVVSADIKATIGGSLSYDTSMTVSASGVVPAKSSRSVYLQYKYVTARYRYVVQKQVQQRNKWRNFGKPYTRYNVSTTKIPVLVF